MSAETRISDARTGPRTPRVTSLDITVLAGGPSSEREVSLESGRAVHQALMRLGHRSEMMDISPAELRALDRPADCVFIALHGAFGEDGQVQALLEERGLVYTGSGVEASRQAMHKVRTKERFIAAGVPTPPFEEVTSATVGGLARRFQVPAVVKPVASGSSVDTTIARTPDALETAAREVADKYGSALVESYVSGPELTVGILGDQALPVCQIKPAREFYDYHAKYVADDTKYLFDIDLPADLLAEVQALSLKAHQALGCAVFSRVDWMIERATLRPYALEVNTIPGFTGHSLLPKAAGRIGIGFDDLCQRVIDLSLDTKESGDC